MTVSTRAVFAAACLMAGSLIANPVLAEKRYDPGANDTEIKIGQTWALSGPVAGEAYQSKVHAGYFRYINDKGGINGRKINFITLDDGYSPPRTMEQTRRLVEQEEVLFIALPFGTPTNAATQRYLSSRKIPQVLVLSGASRFFDGKRYPWSTGAMPTYTSEAVAYAEYLLRLADDPAAEIDEPKIGVLYQNDDFGRDYLDGLKAALGDRAKGMIVHEANYEPTDPTIDSQLISLRGSGANVYMMFTAGRATTLAIRRASELGWKPLKILNAPWASIDQVMRPAGLDHSLGIVSAQYLKEPGDPRWADDPGVAKYLDFMKRYVPDVNPNARNAGLAYLNASMLAQIIEQAGDNLTRDNIMKQALALENFENAMLLPGLSVTVSDENRNPVRQLRIVRFDGENWVPAEKED